MERFLRLRETAFADPRSFFHRFSQMSEEEATDFGTLGLGTRSTCRTCARTSCRRAARADLILRKGRSHAIEEVALRRFETVCSGCPPCEAT